MDSFMGSLFPYLLAAAKVQDSKAWGMKPLKEWAWVSEQTLSYPPTPNLG